MASLGTSDAAMALAGSIGGGKIISDVLLRWPSEVRGLLINQMLSSEAVVMRLNAVNYLTNILNSASARRKLTDMEVAEIMRGFDAIVGDKRPIMRTAGLSAYARVRNFDALPTINRIAKEDPDASVRAAATKAAQELTGIKK